MSATANVPTHALSAVATARPTVWKHGLGAAAAASVATTVLAAVASAAGVSFADHTGASIPVAGFAQVTFVLAMIGVGIAAVIARTARHPRSMFVKTAVGLTVVSLVPDATFGFDVPSAITLMALHIVAAVIVVPVLANRLTENR
jgi:hypothetical protein